MTYEIKHHQLGAQSYYSLRVWKDGDKSKLPIVHTGKQRAYITKMLKRYTNA